MKKINFVNIFLVFLIVFVIGFAVHKNTKKIENTGKNEQNEFIPEEEISSEQNRMTIVTLYFVDPETKDLVHEAKSIDVKELLEKPYEKVIGYLIEGAQNEKVGSSIPEGTILNSAILNEDNLVLDFNDCFVKDIDTTSKEFKKICDSITRTCIEFNEVSNVTFLVNGKKIE